MRIVVTGIVRATRPNTVQAEAYAVLQILYAPTAAPSIFRRTMFIAISAFGAFLLWDRVRHLFC